jgi:hypothetical protein
MQVLENGGYDDNTEIRNASEILKILLHFIYEEQIVVCQAATEKNFVV